MSLLGRSKVVPAIIPTAGAAEAVTCAVVTATGFDRACFLISTGAAATGATLDLKVTEAAVVAMTSAADVSGAALTQVAAATGASKVYAIDLRVNPAKPFLQLAGAVGTDTFANAAVCVLYEGSGTYPKTAATEAVVAS